MFQLVALYVFLFLRQRGCDQWEGEQYDLTQSSSAGRFIRFLIDYVNRRWSARGEPDFCQFTALNHNGRKCSLSG